MLTLADSAQLPNKAHHSFFPHKFFPFFLLLSAHAVARMWLVSRLVSRAVGVYKHIMDATKEFFIRVLMAVLIFLGYVLLSLFIYAVIRRIMVPQKLHVIPVHLQYK